MGKVEFGGVFVLQQIDDNVHSIEHADCVGLELATARVVHVDSFKQSSGLGSTVKQPEKSEFIFNKGLIGNYYEEEA